MAKRGRLDSFVAKRLQISKKAVRNLLIEKQLWVDGELATGLDQQIDEFSHIVCASEVLQQFTRRYYLLHKPVGVVSATKDDIHPTALSLLPIKESEQAMLHIAGRLDLNSTGALIITNDAKWSDALMAPERKVAKEYLVTLGNPIDASYIQPFLDGMYFGYEDITTKPAELEIVSDYQAKVTLREGKYHQIKRMFGRFRNPVVALHRTAIGEIKLADLPLGEYRELIQAEVDSVKR
ncbi:pseudouridine synthase [Shewanella sp. WXL01]|uniref:16S rRNA pseudouridine(516) synthase n=1 Tax=Shewanella sp. WXL01 TaxID=2709721 RepID=UPI001438647A|nr:16S rRNA pseudouridine(516) synthase [Shewanella sp. WXL01]NKF49941.1 pseudouridine synthase [Shewanella sp. WXL01]